MLFTAMPVRGLGGTTGSISGTVRDENGRPIANVRVLAVSPQQALRTTTDGLGNYTFMIVAPGAVRVSFDKTGYRSYMADVLVQADTWSIVPVSLERSRRVLLVDFFWRARLVRQGVSADLYELRGVDIGMVPPPQSVPQQLRYVPGITFSSSAAAQLLMY